MNTLTVNLKWKRLCVLFSFLTLFSTSLLLAAPILDCNNLDVTISCTTSLDEIPKPSVTSDCGSVAEITLTYQDDMSGLDACGHSGVIIRTYTATDTCSETATCVQTITITNEAPVLNCPNLDVTIACDAPRGENDLPIPSVTDACSNNNELTLTFVDDESNLNNCTGFFTRTWTATDACGLTATCIQTITIIEPVSTYCEGISIQTIDNELVVSGLDIAKIKVRISDESYHLLQSCEFDCATSIRIPNVTDGELYRLTFEFFSDGFKYIYHRLCKRGKKNPRIFELCN